MRFAALPLTLALLLVAAGFGVGQASARSRAKVVPDVFQIALRLSRTVEVSSTSEHFVPTAMRTVPDGKGGWITAVLGQRFPTADGYGMIVFFWHNRTYLGTDSAVEHLQADLTGGGPGYIVVTYDTYTASAPACCPTGKVKVRFTLRGRRLIPSGPLPKDMGGAIRITTIPG